MTNFVRAGALWIPDYLSREYRSELLHDFGLAYAVTHSFLWGQKLSLPELRSLLSTVSSEAQLRFGIWLAAFFAKAKALDADRNADVHRLMSAAIRNGQASGLVPVPHDRDPLTEAAFAQPEATNLLLTLCLTDPSPSGSTTTGDAEGTLARACTAINDLVLGPTVATPLGTLEMFLENMRWTWIQEPQLYTGFSLPARIHRFSRIVAALSRSALMPTINDRFEKTFGVRAADYICLQPALQSSWLDPAGEVPPGLALDPSSDSSWPICKALRALSSTQETYRRELEDLIRPEEPLQVRSSKLLRTLVRKPFLCRDGRVFILLGPHLLLRQLDLALEQAFLEQKAETEDPNQFFGALGDAAEEYGQELLHLCVSNSSGTAEGMPIRPKPADGVGDFLILSPDYAIIFEVKFRRPPLKCFEPSAASLDEFKSWVEANYLATRANVRTGGARPGALQQLSDAADRILRSGYNGVRPRRVYPVIVNPQDLIFAFDFLEIIDHKISAAGLFSDNARIAAPVALGLGALEMFCGANYGAKGMAFSQIVRQKADDPSARHTSWPTVMRRLDLSVSPPDAFRRTYQVATAGCAEEIRQGRMLLKFLA
jgi:hypothetical protein